MGTVNNLFDAKNNPYIKALDLYKELGVSSSTGSSKSKEVRNLLNLDENSEKWTIKIADSSADAEKEAAVAVTEENISENNEANTFRFAVNKNFVVAQKNCR